ncbi:MAG: PD-(D/E)XK nuclease family transposase, partial [Cyanobacteria bacterium J06560_2]
FEKTIEQLKSQQDKWLYLFRHLPDLDSQPSPFQDPVFLQLFEIAEIANFSRSEQDGYQSSLKYYRDLNNVIDTSWMEGNAKGLEQGREQGIEQGRKLAELKMARSLLDKLPAETISQITGLSQLEIEQLASTD